MNNIIVIIPARGGSRGVPKKNIKLFNRRPLIEHSIMYAESCKLINKIIVSTDCDEISNVALNYKSEVIKRPKKIS